MSKDKTQIVYFTDSPHPNFPENSLIWVRTVIVLGYCILEL